MCLSLQTHYLYLLPSVLVLMHEVCLCFVKFLFFPVNLVLIKNLLVLQPLMQTRILFTWLTRTDE